MRPCLAVNQAPILQLPVAFQEAVVPPDARRQIAVGGVVEPVVQLAAQVPLMAALAHVRGHVALAGVPLAGAVVQTAVVHMQGGHIRCHTVYGACRP